MIRTRSWLLAALISVATAVADDAKPFAIQVVDEATGRGVPLVELRTVNNICHYTDSAGLIAFNEPGLMGREVYFHIASHGYEYPKDGFGFRGVKLRPTAGGSATVKIKRLNIAERLYRVTGQGIYRDSLLLGRAAPIEQPAINGRVLGQDSVQSAIYRGKIYWFWGDTNRESYPLGQFSTSGATSDLPGRNGEGGLPPGKGVNLKYFVDTEGFSKKMAPLPEPGPVWLDSLVVLKSGNQERLYAHYSRMKSLGQRLEHGLMLFNDEKEIFEKVMAIPDDAMLYPNGHAFISDGREGWDPSAPLSRSTPTGEGGAASATALFAEPQAYIYFPFPFPMVRVKADEASFKNLSAYEAFTCLKPGSRYSKSAEVHRDADGKAVWAWKPDTDHIDLQRQRELLAAGKLKSDEAWIDLRDTATKKPIVAHASSVAWNNYRKKWIMIVQEKGGASLLGEIWYSEADQPHGPWRWATKIITHDKYSFYNPRHHAFFDEEGGRLIYFEGTYSDLFSGAKSQTPWYDYNQIMYRLDLGDTRMRMPASP
jgi:hypothetical protein